MADGSYVTRFDRATKTSEQVQDMVLSIKPRYAHLILDELKTVELRRRFPIFLKGRLAYIYSSSPDKAIIGSAKLVSAEIMSLNDIWENYSHVAYIDKHSFDVYFSGLSHGFVINIGDVTRFKTPIGLNKLREEHEFSPPQSYIYAKPKLREVLAHERVQVFN